jgi:hypothetical protein
MAKSLKNYKVTRWQMSDGEIRFRLYRKKYDRPPQYKWDLISQHDTYPELVCSARLIYKFDITSLPVRDEEF